jgi:hypothetical protein
MARGQRPRAIEQQLYQIIHPEMTLDLTNEEEKSEKELVQILMVCFSGGFVSLIHLT